MADNVPVTIQLGQFAQGYCWPNDPQQYASDLLAILTAFLSGQYANIGANYPSADDQNKPWIKTDNNGAPVGLYTFAEGYWVRTHPVPPSSQAIMIWKGTEQDLWAFEDSGAVTDPALGGVTDITGSFWQRDTDFGSASTVGRFPVGIGVNPITYDGNPATNITPGWLGGVERYLIAETNLPLYSPMLSSDNGTDNVWTAVHGTGATKNGPGLGATDVQNEPAVVPNANYGVANPVTVNNLPPAIGVIFAKRTARRYYVA